MLNLLRGEAGVDDGTLPIQTSTRGGDHAAFPESLGASSAVIDASSAGPIVLDGEILLKGDYSRHGADLTIVGPDGDSVTLTGYFDAGAPDLHSADGAMLAGKTVSLLAGPESPGQYAQAGAAAGGNPIGAIQLLEGTATVQRASGVVEPLQVGSSVFEDDVVSTGGGSKLSVKFVDGTALSMSADARMIMDELVYDPGRTDNSMVLNLVQGSFVFVTGLVAKTGSVRADTPVATMGIRGTTPTVSIDSVTRATTFGIAPDPDGTIGSYVLVNLQTGQLLGTVNSTSFLYRLASVGGVLQQIPATDGDSDALQLLQDTYQTFGQPGSQPGGQPNQDGGDGDQNNNQPPPGQRGNLDIPIDPIGTDVANTIIDDLGDELELLTVADLAEFADEEDDDLDIEPSISTPPDSFEAGDGNGGGDAGSSASVFAFNGPSGVDEDGSVVLSGFDIQYTGTIGVDIVAGSTVTLATTAGLTFVRGDGVDDEEMEFYGSVEDVRAALEGAIYQPTGNSNIGSLVITFFDASGSTIVGSVSVPVTVTPVPDAPIARNDLFFDIPEDAGRGGAPFQGNLFADNGNGIDYDPDNYASGRPPAGAAPTNDFFVSRFRVDADRDGSFSDENWVEVAPGGGGTFIIETGQYAGLTGTISRNGDFTITPGPGFDNLSAGESGFLGSIQYEITSTVDGRTGTGVATGFVTGQNDAPTANDDNGLIPLQVNNADFSVKPDFSFWAVSTTVSAVGGSNVLTGVDFSTAGINRSLVGALPGSDGVGAVLQFGATISQAYGIAYGPKIVSDVFSSVAGDSISFVWKLESGGDYALGYGYLVDAATNQIVQEIFRFDDITEAFSGSTGFQTETLTVSTSGSYYLSFQVGSYDWTGGLYVGARLTLDFAGVSSKVPTDATARFLASQLLANDTDPDGDNLSITSVSTVSALGASVTLNSDGTITYDPRSADIDSGSEDSFTYTITDGKGGTSTATVRFTVGSPNSGPVAEAVSASVNEGGTVVVAADFTDPDAGDTHTFSVNTTGTDGRVSVGAEGEFTYEPYGAFDYLAVGETATDTFAYTVTDSAGASSTATVTVTVTGQNDAPSASGIAATVSEDGPSAIILPSFTDPDATDLHDVSIDADGLAGLAFVDSQGRISYDPNGMFGSLAEGESTSETFSYTVTDEHGASSVANVTVTIEGANDDPQINTAVSDITGGVTEDSAGVSRVAVKQVHFSDVDWSDSHSASASIKSLPAGFQLGTMTASVTTGTEMGQGGRVTWSYSVDNASIQYLAAGQTVTETWTVTVDDGNGGTAEQDVTITITGTNDDPTIDSSSAEGAVFEDSAPTLSTTGFIDYDDIDTADTHMASVESDSANPFGGTLTLDTSAGFVGWTYELDNALVQHLAAGETATERFTVTIDDGKGGTVEQVVTVTITGTNDAPEIFAAEGSSTSAAFTESNGSLSTLGGLVILDQDVTDNIPVYVESLLAGGTYAGPLFHEELTEMFSLGTNFVDADPPSGSPVGWTFDSGEQNFDFLGQGETLVLDYTISAGDGVAAVQQVVSITITGTNDAPVASALDMSTSESATTTIQASFIDPDHADTHGFSIGSATYGVASIAGDGTITYNPNGAFDDLNDGETATDTFTYTVSDGRGGSSTATVTVTINGEGVDVALVAKDDAFTINEDAGNGEPALNANLFADNGNGADEGNALTLARVRFDNNGVNGFDDDAWQTVGPGGLTIVGSDTRGPTMSFGADGSFAFAHGNEPDLMWEGYSTSFSFQYEVTDGETTDTGDVTVTTQGRNDAPSFGGHVGDSQPELVMAFGNRMAMFVNPGLELPARAAVESEFYEIAAMAAGDLDKDGDLDLVLATTRSEAPAGSDANVLRILLNDGTGNFEEASTTSTEDVDYSNVAVADLDNDGRLDIFAGSESGFGVWMNDSDVGLVPATFAFNGSIYEGASEAAFADVDGDEDLDVVVSGGASTFAVLVNNGEGQFTTGQTLAGDGTQIVTGDLDGDGDDDLGLVDASGNFAFYTNDGDGQFTEASVLGIGTGTRDIALADFDGDETLDLLAVGATGQSRVWFNDQGTGALNGGGSDLLIDTEVGEVVTGDADGDGDTDFVILRDTYSVLYVNDGEGRFTQSQQIFGFSGTATAAVFGDFDTARADQRVADIAAGNLQADGTLLFSDPDIVDTHSVSFTLLSAVHQGTNDTVDAIGGFDAYLDQVTFGYGAIPWSFSVSQETLAALGAGDVIVQTYEVKVTDEAGAEATETVTITITGTNDAPQFLTQTSPGAVEGIPDPSSEALISLSVYSGLSGVIGDGVDAVFQIDGSDSPSHPAVGDINGDGHSDFVIGVSNAWTDVDGVAGLHALLSDGAGGYEYRLYEPGLDVAGVELFDVDGDGDTDALIGEEGEGTWWTVALNDGFGEFSDGAEIGALGHFAIGDIDLDGDQDIVSASGPFIEFNRNDGNGNFVSLPGDWIDLSNPQANVYVQGLDLADLDGNGRLDVVARVTTVPFEGSTSYQLTLFQQDQTGAFTATQLGSDRAGDVHLADFDGDGRLDLILADYENESLGQAPRLSVRFGDGSGGFGAAQVLGSYMFADAADYDNDGDTDLAVTYEPYGGGPHDGAILSHEAGGGSSTTANFNGPVAFLPADPAIGTRGRIDEGLDFSNVENQNALRSATGTIAFRDPDANDTQTVSVTPESSGYLGSFSANVTVSESGRFVNWTFSVQENAIDFLGEGERVEQRYTLTLDDGNGGTATQEVTVAIVGRGDGNYNFVEGTNGDETLHGTAYDPNRSDWIRPLDSTDEVGNNIIATGGNDFIDFEGASNGWNSVDYSRSDFLASGNIGVVLTSATAFVTKGSSGTDIWYNVDQITQAGGLGIYTGEGNHSFVVDATIPDFLELGIGRGFSTLTAVNNGNLRVFLQNWNGVTVDAQAGFAEETGGGAYLNVSGYVRQWQGTSGNDTLMGSDAGEIFITQGGINTVDGRSGYDILRYDRPGVSYLNVVYSAPGTAIATGLWFGQAFLDNFSSIEEVRGARAGATAVYGSEGVDVFAGRGAHNSFVGFGGDDIFTGSGGQDLIVIGAGDGVDTINAFTVGQDLIDLTLLGVTQLTELATFEFVDGNTVIRSAEGDGLDVIGVDLTNVAPEQAFILSRIIGTTGDDNAGGAGELIGTDSNDMILGRGGNDTLIGGEGHDILRSGGSVLDFYGIDSLYGGAGNDVLVAEGGFTTMVGGAGNDIMIATFEFGDRFWDGARADYSDSQNGIIANLTSVQRSGVAAMRVADGEGGLDTLININQIRDTAWDDQVFIDSTYSNFRNGFVEVRLSAGNDSVSFFNGFGRISYRNAAEGVDASLERGNAFELDGVGPDFIGFDQFSGATELRGSFHGDLLQGNAANNLLVGSAGNDTILGGDGFDYIAFGDSPSGVIVDLSLSANQVIDDGHGTVDTLTSIESVAGSLWSDTISGDDNANNLEGNTGDDYLFGGGGNDYLSGDFGNGGGLLGGDDTLDGGEGNDTLHGGDGADTFVFSGNNDSDFIDDFDFDEGDRIDVSGHGFSSVGDFYAFLYDSGLQATVARFSESNSVTLFGVDLTQMANPDDAFIFSSGFRMMAIAPGPFADESVPVFTGTSQADTFIVDDGVFAQFENFDPANDTLDISALLDTPFNASDAGSFAFVDANWLSDGTSDGATLFVDADGAGDAAGFEAVASLAFDKPVSETVINLVFEQSAEAVQVQASAAA